MSENKVYFMQHGLAVDKATNPERPLSETGVEQTRLMARHLQQTGATIKHVFHSGKLRALQTAEIIAASASDNTPSALDYLSPNDDVKITAQQLNTENALYVGHLPHLEKLVSYLLCGDETAGLIKFQNSAIVCLEKSNGKYTLLWYLSYASLTK